MNKNKICGIYKIENMVNGKVYIGQSVNIKRRWSQHKFQLNNNTRENNHLNLAWNKYGQKNFAFNIVEECLIEELNNREIYWINYYKSFDSKYGYNKTSGGNQRKEISQELKEKLRECNIGIHRGKNSERAKYLENDIKRVKMMLYLGVDYKTISLITKIPINYLNQIKNLKKWKYTLEEVNKEIVNIKYINNYKEIEVLMLDTNLNVLSEYQSLKSASVQTGININSIFKCCNNKQLLAGNYIWIYKRDYNKENINKITTLLNNYKIEKYKKRVCSIDKYNKIINVYENCLEASRTLNLCPSAIYRVCIGERKTTKGFRFRYLHEINNEKAG